MKKTDNLVKIENGDLFYNEYNLKLLATKYKTPLKITFLDIIKERALNIKNSFDKAIKSLNYTGKYIYLNANKANYGAREVVEAFKYSDGLETSSYYDVLFTRKIFEKANNKTKYIFSNGYKPDDYLSEIINMNNQGYNITNIIDSINEYEYLKSKNISLNVGLRVHLKAQYIEEGEIVKNDRFGLTKEEFEYILKDLANTNLTLTTIHFHQRGFDYEEDKFKINFNKVFLDYYIKAAKTYSSVINFNIGGGTPLPFNREFDYDKWALMVIGLLKEYCAKYSIKEPNLISENGKYSQKDATINIYKVVGIKNTDNLPWYIVDGSLMIALPEMVALGEPIEVRPINSLNNKMVKARLAGITCDCDDIYYLKDKGYIDLPETSELYIGCLGTGSYQNSMSGKGGLHHCLLPEEKDLLIYENEDGKQIEEIRHELQTIDEVVEISGLNIIQKI